MLRPCTAPTPVAVSMAISTYIGVCNSHSGILQTFKFAIFALNFLFCRFCRRGAPALRMCYRALHALRASRPARPSGAAPPSSGLPWAGGMGPDSPPRDWASTLPATRPPVASAEVMCPALTPLEGEQRWALRVTYAHAGRGRSGGTVSACRANAAR